MIRRLLPYTLTCGATFIVLPSVAANGTGGAQVVTELANTEISLFAIVFAGMLLLALGARLSIRLIAAAVAERLDRRRIRRILVGHSHKVLEDFILPGAYGGLTHIDHGILTPGGVFCIQTKHCAGAVFGNADEPQWTNVDGKHRRRFLNPLIQNEGRTRALRNVVPDVPVANLVVFRDSVKFTAPMPDNVVHLRDLNSYLAAYKFGPCDVADMDDTWAAIRSSVLTDEASRKDFRAQLSFS